MYSYLSILFTLYVAGKWEISMPVDFTSGECIGVDSDLLNDEMLNKVYKVSLSDASAYSFALGCSFLSISCATILRCTLPVAVFGMMSVKKIFQGC